VLKLRTVILAAAAGKVTCINTLAHAQRTEEGATWQLKRRRGPCEWGGGDEWRRKGGDLPADPLERCP